jgi:hypothetical protein
MFIPVTGKILCTHGNHLDEMGIDLRSFVSNYSVQGDRRLIARFVISLANVGAVS